MGRNRGQNDKKKGEEKVKVRSHKPWCWPRNREHNLLREAAKAQRKLERLMKRKRDGKPGGIMPASKRSERLYNHIRNLKAQTKTYPNFL